MKHAPKFYALLAALLVLLLALTACAPTPATTAPTTTAAPTTTETTVPTTEPESTDPVDTITENMFSYSFTAEGYGEFVFYFHFYEEDPVLGKVFFAGLSNNRVNFAGTYTVEKVDYAYACFPDRDAAIAEGGKPLEGTAPYTVSFFDWDGNELGKCGYDGTILYNDMKEGSIIYSQGGAPVYYNRDTEGKFAETYTGELGVRFLEFVADEDETSTLLIAHNKTYTDLVGAMIEGTWTVEKKADGGLDFVLKPNDSTDTGAKVSVPADKKTCTYTADGGDAVAMTNILLAGPQLAATFEGIAKIVKYNMDATITLSLFDDNTCTVVASLAGNKLELDKGTYKKDSYNFVFDFEKGEDVTTTLDAAAKTLNVQYKITGTDIGDIDTMLTVKK
ncbi:MAG TPA: hypothetical protein DCM45_06875 [Clostridiales bacterium]|nr:hypothetical protein [Clostridiales bacterium]